MNQRPQELQLARDAVGAAPSPPATPKLRDMARVTDRADELARQLDDLRQQQQAIGGVLRAMTGAAGLDPVLNEVMEAAKRLSNADYGALYLLEDRLLHVTAFHGEAGGAEYDRAHPHALDRSTGAGRAAVTRAPV